MGSSGGHKLDRDTFAAGEFRAYLISIGADPDTLLTEEEIEASLETTLAGRSDAVWLFAYGSLMWNPAIRIAARRVAVAYG